MKRTIIVTRNGKMTVVSGWRATLLMAGGSLLAALVLVLLGVLVFGAALTIATVLVFALPLALILVVVAAVFFRTPPR